jgi:hypothetical protein
LLQRLRLCRIGLLIVIVLGLLSLAPMELLTEINSYFQIITVPADTLLQSNLFVDLTRPNFDYPGEFMLAANLAPNANYFGFVLKQVNQKVAKSQNCKVIGATLRLHIVSLVILLFYIFYLNSRTAADADPLAGKWFKNRKVEALC